MKYKTSVIIPTYNGATKIGNLLYSLQKQAVQPDEVIVVIDGSTDKTLECVQPFANKFLSLRVILQPNMGRAAVRNRGVAEASGDILIFYDDDMKAGEESIKRHIAFHQEHQGILCGNPVEPVERTKTDIQNYKAFLCKKWTLKFEMGITRMTMQNLFFAAANCSIRKPVFHQLNGFDERLTDAEDYDFACRAIQEGVPVFFDKANEAIHVDPITCKSYIHRLRAYGKAHEALRELHPHRYPVNYKRPSTVLKRIIYRISAFSWWVRMIDEGKIIRWFPMHIRYKLYDVVIQGMAVEYPHEPL